MLCHDPCDKSYKIVEVPAALMDEISGFTQWKFVSTPITCSKAHVPGPTAHCQETHRTKAPSFLRVSAVFSPWLPSLSWGFHYISVSSERKRQWRNACEDFFFPQGSGLKTEPVIYIWETMIASLFFLIKVICVC